MLSQILSDETKLSNVRQNSGIILKNAIGLQNEAGQSKWIQAGDSTRGAIKQNIFKTLACSVRDASKTASLVLAAIGVIEIPLGLWESLISDIAGAMKADNHMLKISLLTALGYLCQDSDEDALTRFSGAILGAVMSGIESQQPLPVREAGCQALLNALPFVSRNMSNDTERSFLMNTICDLTKLGLGSSASSVAVGSPEWLSLRKMREKGYECLVLVCDKYYEYLLPYMSRIFEATIEAIRGRHTPPPPAEGEYAANNEEILLLVLDMWLMIGEREKDLEERERNRLEDDPEAVEVGETGSGMYASSSTPANMGGMQLGAVEVDGDGNPVIKSLGLCKMACSSLLPEILPVFLDISENTFTAENWNPVHGAEAVLEYLVVHNGDTVLSTVNQFIASAFARGDWKGADAAIRAFGCLPLACSDDAMKPLVDSALPKMFQLYFTQPTTAAASSVPSAAPGTLAMNEDAAAILKETIIAAISKVVCGCVLLAAPFLSDIVRVLEVALADSDSDVVEGACQCTADIANIALKILADDSDDDDIDEGDGAASDTSVPSASVQIAASIEATAQQTNFMSGVIAKLFDPVLQKAMNVQSFGGKSTAVAWNAANLMLNSAAADAIPFVSTRVKMVLDAAGQQMQESLARIQQQQQQQQGQPVKDQLLEAEETQYREYLMFLSSAVQKLASSSPLLLTPCFEAAVRALSLPMDKVNEEALALLEGISDAEESNFLARLPACMPHLTRCIQMIEYDDIVITACNTVGSVVRSSDGKGREILQQFLPFIVEQITKISAAIYPIPQYTDPFAAPSGASSASPATASPSVSSNGLPPLPPEWVSLSALSSYLSLFFDYALEWKAAISQYIPPLCPLFAKAACVCGWPSPQGSQEKVDLLRSSALECFSAAFHALNPKTMGSSPMPTAVTEETIVQLVRLLSAYAYQAISALLVLNSPRPSTPQAPQPASYAAAVALPQNALGGQTMAKLCALLLDMAQTVPGSAVSVCSNRDVVAFVLAHVKDEDPEVKKAARSARKAIRSLKIKI